MRVSRSVSGAVGRQPGEKGRPETSRDEDFFNHKHTEDAKIREERPGEARRPLEGVLGSG